MKPFLCALAFAFVSVVAEPTSFPPPIGAPRAVSDGAFGPAVGYQGHPHIASNGEVAIAMWGDSKGEWWGTRVSPIDSEGNVLDPIGTLINDGGYPEAIYWNGTEFVAMTIDGSKRTRVRLTAEGQVIDSVVLGMPVGFNLAAVSDDGQRLLFVEWSGTRAAIADRHGEMAGDPVALATLPEGSNVRRWFGAARNGEFLVVRFVRSGFGSTFDLIADRIDRSGNLVSSTQTKLPVDFDENYVVAGGGEGFLFVTQNWMAPAVIAYRLDASGVFTGTAITLVPDDPDLRHIGYKPSVVRDGSRFLVAWHMSFNHGESEVRVASIPDGAASVTGTHRLGLWPGISAGVALAAKGSQIVALASVSVLGTVTGPDLFSIRVAPTLAGDAPRLVAASRTAQTRIDAAAGDNGFGVVWVEDGPDYARRVLFRRFTAGGMPQGERVEVDRLPGGVNSLPYVRTAVVSNGPVYLLLWNGSNGPRGRRIDAAGAWIDAEAFPVPFGFGPTGVTAGNDEAAVAAGARLLRIRFRGEPIAGTTTVPNREYAFSAAVATNGDGYLMVWSEGFRECHFLCIVEPFQLLAARFTADGTLLDPSPIVLEDRVEHPDLPSVAWAGDRYLVVWSGGGIVRGATVSRDGVVIEGNPLSMPGIALDERNAARSAIPRVVVQGESFVLVTSANGQFSPPARFGSIDGVRFRYDTPLRTVATMQRRPVAERTYEDVPALAAGANGRLLVGWSGEAEPDRAPRTFFQIFGQQERRRAIRR